MQQHQLNRIRLLTLGAGLAWAGLAHADFTPIALTPGSFTADVVIEKTAPPPFPTYVNITMDGGTNNNGNTWYEKGYHNGLPNTGLPPADSTFTPTAYPDHQFKMPPSYSAPNCLYLGGANAPGTSTFVTHVATGTLTFTTPTAFSTLSFLVSGGGNPSNVVSYVITHVDNSTETGTFDSPDWFNNTLANVAWVASGRVNMDNGSVNNLNSTTTTKLFLNDIPLSNTTSPVKKIDFSLATAVGRSMIFAVSGSTGAGFMPIDVTGFNKDVVVEATALRVGFIGNLTTVTMDSNGTNYMGNTYFERGLRPGDTTTGLPPAGSTFTNAAGNHIYRMPPTYVGNNCLFVSAQTYASGTLTFPHPTSCSALSLLAAAGNGPLVMNCTVHFQDSTTQSSQVSVTDWFNAATAAYYPNGRFQIDTLAFNSVGTTTGSHLYANDIAINNTSPITSIDLTWVSGGRAPVFAVSGQTNSSGTYYPLDITGFNADAVVEATGVFPHPPNASPNPLLGVTTASMDGGTNNTGNTWFEQGWYPQMPSAGLPPAGSTITSLAQPGNRYQMPASYTGNNAAFVDSVHTNINLTPVDQAAYSALSFLSATANGNVTNRVIIQYLDGTSETNQFLSVDWFNNSPYAFVANGRASVDTRTVNNDPGRNAMPNNPRFYEAQFFLSNFSSPVTNLVLQFLGAANATSGRMVVMAVSGATGAVGPIMNSPSIVSINTYEGSNIVFSVGNVVGTPPITNQWQISRDGGATFVPLANGGNVSGVTTPTLTISNVSVTNAGQYKLISSNPVGGATSATATLSVISGLPEITKPGDSIVVYPATSTAPAAESVDHAIDNLVGANPGKYLNNSGAGSGFVVTPSMGSSIVKAMRFYTANDAQERDPASFVLEGSNDGGNTWTVITNGPLALPGTRNSAASATENAMTHAMQELDFYWNTVGYLSYRVTFPTLYTPGTTLMQIGEVDLLGVTNQAPPIIVRQPPATVTVWVGGSPAFSVGALGTPPLSYQWYRNGNPIPGATQAIYMTNNVQLADSGSTFRCTVSNLFGPTISSSVTLNVISGAPTKPYPVAVLADHPVAFWRLDEAVGATTALDYVGGHSGTYLAVGNEVDGYNPGLDPDKATGFGSLVGVSQDSYVGNIVDLDFAAPTNTSATFSVEAWVSGTDTQPAGAGIIAAGYGGGGEQFAIDVGANNTPTNGLRFYFRDAAGGAHALNSLQTVYDRKWHHVVGVLDEANNSQVFYIDGLPVASAVLTPGLGVRPFASPISIGARQSASGSGYTMQFNGVIDDVAVYNTALSSNQVLAHYYAAQLPPVFAVQPTDLNAAEHSTAVLKSAAYGPGTISYQWYRSTDYGVTYTPVSGTSNLTLVNVTLSMDQYLYYVVATNPYGSTTSAPPAVLRVVTGPPVLTLDLPELTHVYAGSTARFAVAADGSAPMYYFWTSNGVPLANGGRIAGATTNVLTIANAMPSDAAVYRVAVSNAQSASVGGPLQSAASTLYVESVPDFNTNGLGWTANGGATFANNVATLTDNGASQARTIWYNFPLYIGNFYASWVYRDALTGGADGASFCLQNDPRGLSALGGAGGSLGVSGITPSAELEFNIYANNTVGLAYHVNGATGGYTSTAPVALDNGNPIYVTLRYDGAIAHVMLVDSNSLTTFTADLPIGDLRTVLGADTAYVGFTGATGGTTSQQTISNFYFVPLPALSAQASGNALVLSWPASIGGYALQSKADLSSGTWQPVTAPVTQSGGQNQVTVPAATGASYYRLVLPNVGAQ